MAKLVFGMNQSLDGYVDHQEFAPGPVLFRHFCEQVRWGVPDRFALLPQLGALSPRAVQRTLLSVIENIDLRPPRAWRSGLGGFSRIGCIAGYCTRCS